MDRKSVYCRNKLCPLHSRPQFETKRAVCRRCGIEFVEVIAAKIEPPVVKLSLVPYNPAIVREAMAKTLFSARMLSGKSQHELARSMGAPRTWISKVERGHSTPQPNNLWRFALGLGMSIGKFMLIYDFFASTSISANG